MGSSDSGIRIALLICMETGSNSMLRPIVARARREGGLPEATLPTLGAVIDAYVGHVLDATAHNVARTARILDISRSTLYLRLRRL